jgi:hypothetical protein
VCSGPIGVAVRLALFFLVFAFLALLKFLSLLLVLLVHLLLLLLLAALELVLALLTRILAAQFLLLLVLPLLHFLAFGILLTLHFVELLFVLLLQPGIGGRIVGMARRGRPIGSATIIRSGAVIGSAMLNAAAMEIAGARSRRDFRAAVIFGSQEAAVAASTFKMTVLFRGHGNMALVFGEAFLAVGLGMNSSRPAVEADMVVDVLIDDGLVVDVVNHGDVDVCDGAVVKVISAAPVAAHETYARVSETIVNAAVEADVRSPITAMPNIDTIGKSPVPRSPEKSWFGSEHPRAGNPEVTIRAVSPVAGGPNVAGSGTNRLSIDRQGRRANADGDPYGNLCLRGSGNGQDSGGQGKQENKARDTHDFHLPGVCWVIQSLRSGGSCHSRPPYA